MQARDPPIDEIARRQESMQARDPPIDEIATQTRKHAS